jgi:hypothetical protein
VAFSLSALRRRLLGGFVSVAVLGGLVAGSSAAGGVAASVRFGGSWSVVDTCTTSSCAGETFPQTFTIVQKPGSSRFTGVNNIGEKIKGTQSGLSAHFTLTLNGYPSELATFQVAISKDGTAFTGSWVYKNGTGGTTKATRKETSACPVYEAPHVGTDIAVGRVVVIKAVDPTSATPKAAWAQHGSTGKRYPLVEGYPLRAGDIITTGTNTVLVFSGAIGGRVLINKSAKIEVTGPRTVKDVSGNITVSISSIVNKLSRCGKLKDPVEIQENGGGPIKG